MKAEILYKGSVIGTITNNQTISLHCADKVLTDDIVVRAVAEKLGYTIDFSDISINGNVDMSTLTIYDGQDANGDIVYQESSQGVITLSSYQFTSGYFYITWQSGKASDFNNITASGGVTITDYSKSAATLTFAKGTVTGNGAISGTLYGDA